MNKKEYAKLIIEVTSVATKAKILVDQVKQTATLYKSEFHIAEAKLQKIDLTLAEFKSAAATNTSQETSMVNMINGHKQALKALQHDLKANIEIYVKDFQKQFENISKIFHSKILANPNLQQVDQEFDFTSINEQVEQTQTTLANTESELQNIFDKVHKLQQRCITSENFLADLALQQEMKKAADTAARLSKKMAAIETCLHRNPDNSRSGGFLPLHQALQDLSIHARNLQPNANINQNGDTSVKTNLLQNASAEQDTGNIGMGVASSTTLTP